MKKILCIHGVGGKDATMKKWSREWKKIIRELSGPGPELKFCFLRMDDLFAESKNKPGGIRYMEAIHQFISSWESTGTDENFKNQNFLDIIRWYAGMPAQFVTDEELRKCLRQRLEKTILDFRPHLVYAHSLGSLMLYDLLRQKSLPDKMIEFAALTSGSQLGHPAMRKLFGRNILPVRAKLWINLHNEKDRVFASRPISMHAANFLQVETPFESGITHHEALKYLGHENTFAQAWPAAISMSSSKASPAPAISR